jgi:hypothetical protein
VLFCQERERERVLGKHQNLRDNNVGAGLEGLELVRVRVRIKGEVLIEQHTTTQGKPSQNKRQNKTKQKVMKTCPAITSCKSSVTEALSQN